MTEPTNAAAVANAFFDIQAADQDQFPSIDHMKLQKLLYFSHAWWLAGKESGLFTDDIEAWPWGPVVRNIYIQFNEFGRDPIVGKRASELVCTDSGPLDYQFREPDAVTGDVEEFLGAVWKTHKKFTGVQLSNATHAPGEPWTIVKKNYPSLDGKPKIPNELIRDVFKAKLAA